MKHEGKGGKPIAAQLRHLVGRPAFAAADDFGGSGLASAPSGSSGGVTGPPVPPSPPLPGGVVVMPVTLVRDLFRDAAGYAKAKRTGRPSRSRTLLLLSLGGLIGGLIFALVNYIVIPKFVQGDPAQPVAVDDALSEFRSENGAAGVGESVPSQTAAGPDTAAAAAASADAGAGAAATSAVPEGGEVAANAQAAPALLRPPQGVYSFAAKGSEMAKPNALPAETATIGPTIAAVVKHSGGNCWTMSVKFHSKREITEQYCAGAGTLTYTGNSGDMTSYGKGVHNVVKCEPPVNRVVAAMEPGATSQGACTITMSGASNSTSTAKETVTYIGTETVLGVATWHVLTKTQSSGGANGTVDQHVWISQTNGMLVKFTRSVNMTSSAPIVGTATFTEEMTATLESLTPRT